MRRKQSSRNEKTSRVKGEVFVKGQKGHTRYLLGSPREKTGVFEMEWRSGRGGKKSGGLAS